MKRNQTLIIGLACIVGGGAYLGLNADVVSGCGHSRIVSDDVVIKRIRDKCEGALRFAEAAGYITGCDVSLTKQREQTLFDTYVYAVTERERFEGFEADTVLTIRTGTANVCGLIKTKRTDRRVLNRYEP
ncbi:MAG: hypothetical protein QM667_06070 [Asticcacaulis sp.]